MRAAAIVAVILPCFLQGVLCEIYSLNGYNPRRDPRRRDPARNSQTCLTKTVKCQFQATFPNIDGSCNNEDNPTWGATLTPMSRLLPPAYADSKGEPRAYGKYSRLPSAREVSNIMKEDATLTSSDVSHMHVLFGQLFAHDIVHAPIVKQENGTRLDCNCETPHRDCINIEMPLDDEQRVQINKKCIMLARSKAAEGVEGCTFPHREQLSTMSSVIDGTFMYGKSEQEARDVRDPASSSGEIKLVKNPTGSPHGLLPNQDEVKHTRIAKTIDCNLEVHKPVDIPCFVAGDVRANENVGLVAVQTIWARYHNLVARGLKAVNPFWNSDKVFNVARRIMSGLVQSITYREYLPPLLGPVWMKRLGLTLTDHGYWNGYDSRYNPSIMNGFTTAAFRYGHSQVAATLTRPGSFFQSGGIPDVLQENTFFNSEPLLDRRGGGCGSLMRGFMMENAEKTDESILDAMRNQLFRKIGGRFGDDLFAINVQRGRDHGLPPYNKYRELCGLRRARDFADLFDTTLHSAIRKLEKAYAHVDDIDLYVGGLAETHVEGGEVGPTFACILALGFRALRRGDRYWHEYEHSPSYFTPKQLQAIRQMTYARMFCDVGEDMKYVVKFPMKMNKGKPGTIVNCGNVPKLDLTPWRDSYPSASSYTGSNGGEWTGWFVTWKVDERQLDVHVERQRLKAKRPEEICDDILGSQTRYVPRDKYLQVRFLCPIGTIRATDMPFRMNQDHYFTSWMETQDVDQSAFSCSSVVAVQAMVVGGHKYALETGDVFHKFGPDGFSCWDIHQSNGICQRYIVRALCSGRVKHDSYGVDTARDNHQKATPPYTPHKLPNEVRDTVDTYCHIYGLCCNEYSKPYATYVPSDATEYAKYLCTEHRVCCGA